MEKSQPRSSFECCTIGKDKAIEFCLLSSFQIAFLRYPPNIGSIVPLVLGANVAGVLVFFSPDLGYKLGQVTGMDPLQSSYITMASCFAALILIFSTRR